MECEGEKKRGMGEKQNGSEEKGDTG